GLYSAPPANPVSVTGGTGTAATFNLTFAAPVQTDTMATLTADPNHPGVMIGKGVYVAWNTSHTAPTGNFTIPNFNANVIKVVGSSDGGAKFTTPQFVNNDGNVGKLN